MIWLSILGVILVITRYFYLSRQRTEQSLAEPQQASSEGISLEEARAMVDKFVAKADRLIVTPVVEVSVLLDQTGPVTREFFERFGNVRSRSGGFVLGASEVAWSVYVNGFLSIGHGEDWDVVQRPGENDVYIVEGSETALNEMIHFSSIYHALVDEVQRSSGPLND